MLTRYRASKGRLRLRKLGIFILRSDLLRRLTLPFGPLSRLLSSRPRSNRGNLLLLTLWIRGVISLFFRHGTEWDHGIDRVLRKRDLLEITAELTTKTAAEQPFVTKELVARLSKEHTLHRFNSPFWKEFAIEVLIHEIRRDALDSVVTAVTFDLNLECNLRCRHCFVGGSDRSVTLLDNDIIRSTIEQARNDLGCRFFSLLGGEPLLAQEKLLRILDDFPLVPFQIFTNGMLLTSELTRKLEDRPNCAILVSLEGDELLTNEIRGAASFGHATQAFELLRSRPIIYGASLTVNSRNYRYLASADFAEAMLRAGVYYVWLFDYKPLGRAAAMNLQMDDAQKPWFNERIRDINVRYPFLLLNTEKDPDVIGGCPATRGTILHICADGAVSPCVAIRHVHPDNNVRLRKLTDILASDAFAAYRNIGCYRGCAAKYCPDQYRQWVIDQGLVPMYNMRS